MATTQPSFAVSPASSNPIRFGCFAPQCFVRVSKPPCYRRRLVSTTSFQRKIGGGGGGLIRCELPDFHLSATATTGYVFLISLNKLFEVL